ncbi:MAG: replication initiation protein [Lachnospiraceae bacterium]|nr:replication initiation protein [Lachnospiraceae bacterium]
MSKIAPTAIDVYKEKQVALSNALIQAKEKTSLLESKIELLAIYKLKDDCKTIEKKDAKGNRYDVHAVTLNTGEIKRLADRKGGGVYTQIAEAAIELKRKLFIYAEPGKDQFRMDNLYGEVTYDKGKLTVEFNPSTEYLFTELKNNFTKLNLGICFAFKSNGGFQLYKLLRTYMYTLPEVELELLQEEQQYISKEYNVSELRLQLGYVNIDQPEIKKEGMKNHPDSEKMVELEKKPKYKRWNDFYNRVIAPGIEEINEISDIYISKIEPQRGAHGKIESVIFYCQNNKSYYKGKEKVKVKNKEEKRKLTEDEIDDFIDDIRDICKGIDFKTKDLKVIAEASEYDKDKISKAYKILTTSDNINNAVGFMLKAIKEDYEESPGYSKEEKKNGFNDFNQRKYDYAELEREAVSQG